MPNHVTHKLIFAEDSGAEIFSACCPGGKFDFGTLVPQPPHIYKGDLSKDDEQDFKINWSSWNRENWGTKWNAYGQTCGIDSPHAFIKFDTAWSVPYPVIAAFANRFHIPFEHRYFDEGHNFWGIEIWAGNADGVSRAGTRKSIDEDKTALRLELKGYNPEETGDVD